MSNQSSNQHKTAIYLRISGDSQDEKMQRDDLMIEAKRKNISVVEFSDVITGASESRDDLDKLLIEIKSGRITSVWVWRLDRLSRSVRIGLNIIFEIERAGATVEVLKEPQLNTGSVASEDLRTMALWAAQKEREAINMRNKTGKLAWLRQNKWANPPNCPYGYKLTEDYQLEVVPAQAKIIRRIYQMYCYDNKSTRDIASIFNQENITPPSLAVRWNRVVKNPQWRKDAIAKYLKSTIYMGWRDSRWTEKEHDIKKTFIVHRFTCDPIITPELYKLAQSKKLERSTNSKRNLQREYLFHNKIYCMGCSLKLFPRFAKERYKRCLVCNAKAVVRKYGDRIITGKDRCKEHKWSEVREQEHYSYAYQRSKKWDGEAKKRCGISCGTVSELALIYSITKHFYEVLKQPTSFVGKIYALYLKPDNQESDEDIGSEIEEEERQIKDIEDKMERANNSYIDGVPGWTKVKRDTKLKELNDLIQPREDRILELQQKRLTWVQRREQAIAHHKKMKTLVSFVKKIRNKAVSKEDAYSFMKELLDKGICERVYVDFKNSMIKVVSPINPTSNSEDNTPYSVDLKFAVPSSQANQRNKQTLVPDRI